MTYHFISGETCVQVMSLKIFIEWSSWSIFVKDTHVFYVNNAGKAQFVWFRRRQDNEYLTSFVSGKYQQQEPRTNTVNLQAELVDICHYGEENVHGLVGSTVITHLQYLN